MGSPPRCPGTGPGTTSGAETVCADNPPSTQPIYTTPVYNDTAPPHRIPLVRDITLPLRPKGPWPNSHTDRHKRLRGHLAPVAMPNVPTVTQTLRGFSETRPAAFLSFRHSPDPVPGLSAFPRELPGSSSVPGGLGFRSCCRENLDPANAPARLVAGFIKAQTCTGSHFEGTPWSQRDSPNHTIFPPSSFPFFPPSLSQKK